MELKTVAITESFNDIEKINVLAKEAFPPKEYLAPAKLIAMAKDGELDFLALYDQTLFVGFMAVKAYKNMAYLFFLAIDPVRRSSGYGGRAIETLKALYPSMQQVVDLEMLDSAADNSAQRESRHSFYLRNGYRETGHFISYSGIDFEILCMTPTFDLDVFKEMMRTFHLDGFHPHYFTK